MVVRHYCAQNITYTNASLKTQKSHKKLHKTTYDTEQIEPYKTAISYNKKGTFNLLLLITPATARKPSAGKILIR